MKETSIEQARQAFSKFVENRSRKLITFEGNVDAVNESEGTCDVQPTDGSPMYFDVRIVASTDNVVDGIVAIPKVGSVVLCGRFENENNVFIQKTSELSKLILKCSDSGVIEMNGNKYSVIKGETAKTELEKLQAKVDLIINAITTSAVQSGDGGAVYKTNMTLALNAKVDADFTDILNKEVKHG